MQLQFPTTGVVFFFCVCEGIPNSMSHFTHHEPATNHTSAHFSYPPTLSHATPESEPFIP